MIKDTKEPGEGMLIERINEGLEKDLDEKLKNDSLQSSDFKKTVNLEGMNFEPVFCSIWEDENTSGMDLYYNVKISDVDIPASFKEELFNLTLSDQDGYVLALEIDVPYDRDAISYSGILGFFGEEEGVAPSCLRIFCAGGEEYAYFHASKSDLYESMGNETIKDRVRRLNIERNDKFFEVEMI